MLKHWLKVDDQWQNRLDRCSRTLPRNASMPRLNSNRLALAENRHDEDLGDFDTKSLGRGRGNDGEKDPCKVS